ncbi:MAG TPA: response regulator transcription factor [Anaerolineaceae bacterium]|nr:response regulator transcription factor [Anaerolineaceae bacterium]
MSPIRVLLADDHALVRAGIHSLLVNINGIEVVAEAGSGREALSQVEIHRPDVVLMDIAMSDINGLEATRHILENYPDVRVIILSMHATEEYVWEALRSGAKGYLLKDSALTELELAVNAVARGETYLSPPISKQVIDDYISRVGGDIEKESLARQELERLTIRQREILTLIAKGLTTREIALQLNISEKTVETHRTQLMERLDIHDIAGLVRYAIRVGLIRPEN